MNLLNTGPNYYENIVLPFKGGNWDKLFYYKDSTHTPTVFGYILFNKVVWDALSDDEKASIETTVANTNTAMWATYRAESEIALQRATDAGITILETTAAQREKMKEKWDEFINAKRESAKFDDADKHWIEIYDVIRAKTDEILD